jgi:acetyl-CoA synthetase
MDWSPIPKHRGALRREPCLTDYEQARRGFTWDQARKLLDGLPGGALNIAHEAVGRHARGPAGDRRAIRFLARDQAPHDLTFRQLADATHRVANVLTGLGVKRGDRVATLMGRLPALYATVLGTLAAGAVYCPLFSAFGPEPVRSRLTLGSARVLVTTDLFYRRKVEPIRDQLADLAHVLVVRTPGAGDLPAGTIDFDPVTGLPIYSYGDPVAITGFRLVDGRASYGIGVETMALGFPIHFDWSWRTLFNEEWENALFGSYVNAEAWRKARFQFWIGFDF